MTRGLCVLAGLGLAVVMGGCGGGDATTPAAARTTPDPTGAVAAATPSTLPVPSGANRMPPGTLTPTQVHDLMAYFDDRLATAYADGSTDGLDQILAGPELRGNVGTIGVLSAQHRRNLFHVVVDSVTVQSSSAGRVVFVLHDHTTTDTFVDATTGATLDQGLPGPEVRTFLVFFDYNPTTQAWYWTGAQKENQ